MKLIGWNKIEHPRCVLCGAQGMTYMLEMSLDNMDARANLCYSCAITITKSFLSQFESVEPTIKMEERA